MSKIHTIGHYSMDAESYKKFVTLGKEKQVETLLKGMSPKNEEHARELLKNVPNGDNQPSGNGKKNTEASTEGGGNVAKDNTKKS